MMRRALPLALALALVPAAAAQQVYFYHLPGGDSASVLLTGDTGTVQLRASTCSGISAYTVRVYFDDSRMTVLAADSVAGYGLPKPTLASGTEYVQLSASGTGYNSCPTLLANLRFRLDSTAVAGSLLSLRIVALTGFAGGNLLPASTTTLGQVCQALTMWGDADGSRTITSRDALILLSAAVGLPTGGFDLSTGDVDADGAVTTRDALYVLSRAIGLTAGRAGLPRPNRCAPLAPTPADAAFRATGGLWRLTAGDTVPQLLGFAPASGRPTWAPDGSRILIAQFVSGWGNDFVSVRADGSGADTIFVATGNDDAPAWSPDGARIAFTSSRVFPTSLFVMDADGQNQIQLTASSILVFETAWTPDGSEIIITGYEFCCTPGLWAVQSDGSGYREVFTNSLSFAPRNPVVSPAGDSVVFQNGNNGDIYVVALIGGATPTLASQLIGTHSYPNWVPAGLAFRSDVSFPYGFYHQRNDGRILRFARGESSAYADLGMRTPGVWIDAITLDVDSTDVPGSTFQLNATVTNNDATINSTVPVRWVSRDQSIVTVDQTGLVTNQGSGGLTWVVASTGGWRSDSTRINAFGFAPPLSPRDGRRP